MDSTILSSNSIAQDIEEEFEDSEKEIDYKEPLSFTDDVVRMSDDRNKAQEGNKRIEKLVEEKLLSFNLKKSNFILIRKKL